MSHSYFGKVGEAVVAVPAELAVVTVAVAIVPALEVKLLTIGAGTGRADCARGLQAGLSNSQVPRTEALPLQGRVANPDP